MHSMFSMSHLSQPCKSRLFIYWKHNRKLQLMVWDWPWLGEHDVDLNQNIFIILHEIPVHVRNWLSLQPEEICSIFPPVPQIQINRSAQSAHHSTEINKSAQSSYHSAEINNNLDLLSKVNQRMTLAMCRKITMIFADLSTNPGISENVGGHSHHTVPCESHISRWYSHLQYRSRRMMYPSYLVFASPVARFRDFQVASYFRKMASNLKIHVPCSLPYYRRGEKTHEEMARSKT